MIRRVPFALAVVASLTVALAACQSAPAAPALTDPKEIVTKGVVTLNSVKTFEFTGAFTGSAKVPQLGDFDLSTIKMSGQIDVTGKKLKFGLDAPSLLGTKIDALVVDQAAYYKVAGPAAISLHASADKYTKLPIPAGAADPVGQVTDVAALTAKTTAELAKLPFPLTKQPDDKCGDQDCYHVSMRMTAADLKLLDPSAAGLDGDVSLDIWTRKSDYRPAKLGISATSATMGSFGFTLDLRYDVSVSIEAPPADQVVSP